MGDLREAALLEPLEPITCEQLRRAAMTMSPNTGQGADFLSPVDIGRLCTQGLADTTEMLNATEEALSWPWQLLAVCSTLRPKKLGGDRTG